MTSSSLAAPLDVELRPDRPAMLRVDPPDDAARWAAEHREALRARVAEHGALLVRGLGLRDTDQAGAVFTRLAGRLLPEREAFAPREAHGPALYSSTPWPANQPMCMHHELSYPLEVPGLLLFACLTAPEQGGATAVADAAQVLDALPGELTERFEHEGWLLTRTYNDEIGASLAESFGTDDRDEIERYCQANAIDLTWGADGSLRTEQRRSAVVRHPLTGRRCWFNQIAFLNEWTLAPEVREYLLDEYGADGLPFNTRYGDGTPIDEYVVRLLNDTYEEPTRRAPWQAGDLMLVDNIGTAHSREAFTGDRQVVVGLADPHRLADHCPTPEASRR
ncbi:TauD/TfdA family dioxygenase [Streptomyces dangxiongensis]|uniref:TauD/TfdA family dioxygenase n=1 Tax=Streptomyces dangxiongensis TaxID=1442032 RepID=A0A3G2J6H5_9ACTN|nr:TauD/TfdA family dioxygenase [Streptomyces dangxiongensis]AYN37798.1 TauD/TfdA family dioxygenase [Streptomyces dangxiongensis]